MAQGILGKLFGDRGYISQDLFEKFDEQQLKLITRYKKNTSIEQRTAGMTFEAIRQSLALRGLAKRGEARRDRDDPKNQESWLMVNNLK